LLRGEELIGVPGKRRERFLGGTIWKGMEYWGTPQRCTIWGRTLIKSLIGGNEVSGRGGRRWEGGTKETSEALSIWEKRF